LLGYLRGRIHDHPSDRIGLTVGGESAHCREDQIPLIALPEMIGYGRSKNSEDDETE
jgi:hypothetical protein